MAGKLPAVRAVQGDCQWPEKHHRSQQPFSTLQLFRIRWTKCVFPSIFRSITQLAITANLRPYPFSLLPSTKLGLCSHLSTGNVTNLEAMWPVTGSLLDWWAVTSLLKYRYLGIKLPAGNSNTNTIIVFINSFTMFQHLVCLLLVAVVSVSASYDSM